MRLAPRCGGHKGCAGDVDDVGRIMTIGVSRLYLGVHWVTDVLTG